jgi:hypothetical protein
MNLNLWTSLSSLPPHLLLTSTSISLFSPYQGSKGTHRNSACFFLGARAHPVPSPTTSLSPGSTHFLSQTPSPFYGGATAMEDRNQWLGWWTQPVSPIGTTHREGQFPNMHVFAFMFPFPPGAEWRQCYPVRYCLDNHRNYPLLLLYIQSIKPSALPHQMGQVKNSMPRTNLELSITTFA